MFRSLLALGLWLAAAPLMAAGQTVLMPSLGLAARSFEYSSGASQVEGDLLSLGLGLTAINGRFYGDLSWERNLAPGSDSRNTLTNGELDIERQDFALSLGYSVNDTLSLFAGYKFGKTRLSALIEAQREVAVSLKGQGPYLGAGAGWRFGGQGMLAFSAAYAMLDASFQNHLGNSTSGSAFGTSLGLEWKAPLSKIWQYELGLTHHHYFYQDFGNSDFDITERILSLKAGLAYRF
jgi:long-subunit fatty acid transport protein